MYVFTIAFRLLRTRKISWVATAIVAAIVILYLLIIAVLEGFKAHYMDKIQSIQAHMTVRIGHVGDGIVYPEAWAAELEKIPEVRGVTIGLEIPSLAQFNKGRTIGVLRGIDLDRELKCGRLKEILKPPDLSSFGEFDVGGGRKRQGCIIGGLWRHMFGIKEGDLVTFCFTELTAEEDPRAVQYKVVGFFEGQSEYLENAAYVDRRTLAKLVGIEDRAKTLSLWINGDPDRPDLEEIRDRVKAKMDAILAKDVPQYPGFADLLVVDTWREKDNKFYHAVSRENAIMRFIMAIFLVFSSFIIALILGQLVAEKIRDIGTLRALGATRNGILACFLAQGLAIGLIGLAIGLPVAMLFVAHINEVAAACGLDVFPRDAFLIDRIPTRLLDKDILLISLLALTSGVFGALIPALRAARKNPVECLRHE